MKYNFFCDIELAMAKNIRWEDEVSQNICTFAHCHECECCRAIDLSGNVLMAKDVIENEKD